MFDFVESEMVVHGGHAVFSVLYRRSGPRLGPDVSYQAVFIPLHVHRVELRRRCALRRPADGHFTIEYLYVDQDVVLHHLVHFHHAQHHAAH